MDVAVIAIAFGAILLVELPDKTFIATLVLSTRYPGLLVWLGVGAAFLVQTVVAVTAGSLVTLLPENAIRIFAAAIFLLGAIVLIRAAPKADALEAEQEQEYAARATTPKTGFGAFLASFLVLFAAEWGDLSQLLTISLVARYGHPMSVLVGSWAALLTVSALAVLMGSVLLRHMRLSTLHYVGGGVCLVLACVTIFEVVA